MKVIPGPCVIEFNPMFKNPQNQQNQQNGKEKPQYLHEFSSKLESVSPEFKRLIWSIIHPIQTS